MSTIGKTHPCQRRYRALIGRMIGHYTITEKIGEGGMGEVYRATDTKLKRDVALKVLPAAFTADPQRMARFTREAQVLASLSHPNIGAIHGLEEDGEVRALVLELIPGETLAERIARGPIPLEESLDLAVQIAGALEAAHERGIIHRDLKPANIKITSDGQVKVLDFGLAKSMERDTQSEADLSQSPTLSLAATQAGVILGTAAYMSPEQAKGRAIDKQTDVFAFGCVLYECLTGKQAFEGESFTEILAAIIHKEPGWVRLPVSTPPNIVRQLRRCLEKDPKLRTRDMGDVALELRDSEVAEPVVVPSRSPLQWAIGVSVVLLLILGSYFVGAWNSNSMEGVFEPRWIGEKLVGPAVARSPVVSPANGQVAFAGTSGRESLMQVWVMDPNVVGGARQLTRDASLCSVWNLAWSRDGSNRVFYSCYVTRTRAIWSVSAVGEPDLRPVLENANNPRPLANGDLLAVRVNDDGIPQLIQHSPGSGVTQFLPVLLTNQLLEQAIRIIPGENQAVIVGRPEASTPDALHLWRVDLTTRKMSRIAPEVPLPPLSWTFPLAVSEEEVYFVRQQGDRYETVAVPLDGTSGIRSVLTVTRRPLHIDIDGHGNLYLDQIDQAQEIRRIDNEGKAIDRFPLSSNFEWVLPLPDDRFLLAADRGARRLMTFTPGESPVQFLNIDEEAIGPLALVGDDLVAFVLVSDGTQQLGLARIDGRLQARIPVAGNPISGLSASPDGASLYYIFDGTVYRVPSAGGPSEPLFSGDQTAVEPSTRDLVVMFYEGEVVKLARMTLEGVQSPIPIESAEWYFPSASSISFTGGAVSEGRGVARISGPASSYWPVGFFDARSGGTIEPATNATQFDMMSASWDRHGRLVMLAQPFRSELWRFRDSQPRE